MIVKCNAYLCDNKIDSKYFMCTKHWRMVPWPLQRELWNNYRPGQENDMQISAEYMRVAHIIINRVAESEKHGQYPI